jgi:hypothetical protein
MNCNIGFGGKAAHNVAVGNATKGGLLKVITHVQNACQPKIKCVDIRADDFEVRVFTLENNIYNEKISGIPGSEYGWILRLNATNSEGTQYNVKQFPTWINATQMKSSNPVLVSDIQYSRNVTYSDSCQGIMNIRDNKECVITNNIFDSNSTSERGTLALLRPK